MAKKVRISPPRPASANGKADLNSMLQQGLALHNRGQLAEAKEIYEAVLRNQPSHFDALNLLGTLAAQTRNFGPAVELFKRALEINPKAVSVYSNRGNALMGLQRPDEALASYDKALTLKPDHLMAHYNRGLALIELKRLDEAVASYDRVLALKPDYAEAYNNRGVALKDLKRLDEALASYEKALALKPDYADAHYNRAAVLAEFKRFDEALQNCDSAIALTPGSIVFHNCRAVLLLQLERPADALASCKRALAHSPNFVEALNNRGNALKALNRHEEALQSYDQALAQKPESVEILSNRGLALSKLGRAEEGLASMDKALALKPAHSDTHANRAVLLSELGRFDEAGEAIRRAIALSPRRAELYHMLTESSRLAPGEPLIEEMENLAQDIASLDAREQIYLHFALATALAGSDAERSFEHLRAGNALKRKRMAYDERAVLGEMERTRNLFTGDLMRSKAGLGDPSCAPVFIVGMPRSGSTLIEQILASHPAVFGGGEIDLFTRTLIEFRGHGEAGLQFPDAAPFLSGEHLRQIGAAYAGGLTRLAPAAERIADKMLDNFRFAGLIHLALPNARIIHARRDPLDTCFSCFSKLFLDGLAYTYDTAELGRYYCAYSELMSHWRNVLPSDTMLDVQYEELVGDLEAQARRIVAYCGLEWDARCLDFHKTKRQVRTASLTQVRQPIYKSSIGRARLFEERLAPLREALRQSERVLK